MVKPMNLFNILIVSLLLLFSLPIQATEIQVSVDRNPVAANESFQIIFTATQEPDANPDLSALRDNFDILNQQRSSNSSWINGKSSRNEQWIVTVMAKQPGELLIPAITFGSDHSNPLKIRVMENQSAPQNDDDVFMEVTATPETPFVQSQVLYTIRLYRRVQIAQARLDDPQVKDALIEKLGEDSNYSTQISGVDYSVTERRYAIFPQQSGELTIPPLTLDAEVVVPRRQRFNSFFNQPSTETRRIASKAITLHVQAVPVDFKGADWLSAESLEISEEWSDNDLQTEVGEPLTRTLRLTAKGATVGQLPELSSHQAIDGIKTYPDQPQLKEDKLADGLTAVREEKIAYIPSKSGDYTLPALEIQWFNTKTQRIEKTGVPSVTIKALPGKEASQQQAKPMSQPAETQSNQPSSTAVASENSNIVYWQGLSVFLAAGWLVTAVLFYRNRKKTGLPADQLPVEKPDSAIEKALKIACLENDPQTAKQLLLQWGKAQFNVESLNAIAKTCPQALGSEIELLNKYLYSGRAETWNGQPLWLAFSQHPVSAKVKIMDDGLEPLYKL